VKKLNILALAVIAASTLASAQSDKKVGWSTGYYYSWAIGKYPPSKIQWKGYTHMCQFSVTPNGDGSVNVGGMGLNSQNFTDFVTEAHKNKVKAIICVGGAGTGGQFQSATANATVRAKFINGLLAFIKQYNYDGIDMDWEEIGGKETQYIALHKEMREAMDKLTPKPLFTVAMAGYISKACGPIYPYMDQMNNMCYWTKAANLTNDFKPLIDAGIPKSKMGVGIGWDYTEGNPEVDCDPVSTKNKIMYAIDNQYGGVMVWGIEKDADRNGGKWPSTDTLIHYVPLDAPTAAFPRGVMALENRITLTVKRNALSGRQEVSYSVGAAGNGSKTFVDLGMYDFQGSLVKSLVRGTQDAGAYSLPVDRAGSTGATVRPGAYVIKLTAGGQAQAAH
jgi:GH18 family chitinase